jgi:hypothetical protein
MDDAGQVERNVTPWTVGRLRRALEGLPDDTPLRVEAAMDDDSWDEQVVVGAGYGKVSAGALRPSGWLWGTPVRAGGTGGGPRPATHDPRADRRRGRLGGDR